MEYSRNLRNLPFVAIMNKDNFTFVADQIKCTINEIKLLSGKYLNFFNDLEEIQAIFNRHNLNYNQIDNYLSRSDLKSCWPDNRGLFYSENKDIIILINIVDHLKIISINKDYSSCFDNLVNLSEAFEKRLKFETHLNYGYVTTCPLTLGSSLSIRAILKIDNLLGFDFENELLKNYLFDSSQIKNGVLIVEKRHRMKYSESEFLQDFYEKMNNLDLVEKNISNMTDKIIFNDNVNKNVVLCYNDVFDSYKLTLTPDMLFFNEMFDLTLLNENTYIEIFLKSKHFYQIYNRFFNAYFLSEFKYDSSNDHIFNISISNYILEIKDKSKLLNTNIKVIRNLSHLPFNTASTIKANNEEIVKMLNDYFKGSYRNVTNNQILRRYCIQSLSSELYNKGILKEESLDYSGIFLLDEKPILIIVNDIDHLQFEIHLSNPDDMISNVIDLYNVINKIEEKGIRYLYSPHYGYHSQCPRFTGTGFNIFSTLRLNILTSDLEKLEELRTIHKFSYNITEINSDKILEIQVLNQIGMTEKELLEKWKLTINDLIENDV